MVFLLLVNLLFSLTNVTPSYSICLYVKIFYFNFLYINNASIIPIMLETFILNANPNVIFKTLKSKTNGSENPNCCS